MEKIIYDRRKFIKFSTLGMLAVALGGGIALSPYTLQAQMNLRPPGAVKEEDFLALCIKCGQCLQVCPYHSIKLADFASGHGVGTPYIEARERGCYACTAVPCVLACPTGALDHSCEKPEDIKMGIAVLEFPNKCIAMTNQTVTKEQISRIYTHPNSRQLEQDVLDKLDKFEGKSCTICSDMCPIPNSNGAIAMVSNNKGGMKPEVYEGCIGCGVCEELCPANEAAIVVKPRLSFKQYYEEGIRI